MNKTNNRGGPLFRTKAINFLLVFLMLFSIIISPIETVFAQPIPELTGNPVLKGGKLEIGDWSTGYQTFKITLPLHPGAKEGDIVKIDFWPNEDNGGIDAVSGPVMSSNTDITINGEKVGIFDKDKRAFIFNKNVEKYDSGEYTLTSNLFTVYFYNKDLTQQEFTLPYLMTAVLNGKSVGNDLVLRTDAPAKTIVPPPWRTTPMNYSIDSKTGLPELKWRASISQPGTDVKAGDFYMEVLFPEEYFIIADDALTRQPWAYHTRFYARDYLDVTEKYGVKVAEHSKDRHLVDDYYNKYPIKAEPGSVPHSLKWVIPAIEADESFTWNYQTKLVKPKASANPEDIQIGVRVWYKGKFVVGSADGWSYRKPAILIPDGYGTATLEGKINVNVVDKQGNAADANKQFINLKVINLEEDKVVKEVNNATSLSLSELPYGEYKAVITLKDGTGEKPVVYGDSEQTLIINYKEKSKDIKFVVDREESAIEYKIAEKAGAIKDPVTLNAPTHDKYTIQADKVTMNEGYVFKGYSFNGDNQKHQPGDALTLQSGKNTLDVVYKIQATYENPDGSIETVELDESASVSSFLPEPPAHFTWDNNASSINQPENFRLVEDPKTTIVFKTKEGNGFMRTTVYSDEDFTEVPTRLDEEDSFFDGWTVTDSKGNTYDLAPGETTIPKDKLVHNGEITATEKVRPAYRLSYELDEKYGAIDGKQTSDKQEANAELTVGDDITLNLKEGVRLTNWIETNEDIYNNGDKITLDSNKNLKAQVEVLVTYKDVDGNKIGEEWIPAGGQPQNLPEEGELDKWPDLPESIDEPFTLQKEDYFVTVTYQDPDGNVIDEVKQRKNTPATKPEDPTKDKHDFDGWLDGDKPANFEEPIANDKTFIADWTKRHDVTHIIDAKAGKLTGEPKTDIRDNTEFIVGTNVTPELNKGYIFDKWVDELGNPVDKEMITRERVFTAKYKVQVTLTNDKGEETVIEVTPGEKIPADKIPELADGFEWPDKVNDDIYAPTTISAKEIPVEDMTVTFLVDGKIAKQIVIPKGDSIKKSDIPAVNIDGKIMNGWKPMGSDKVFEFGEETVINENSVFIADLEDAPKAKKSITYNFPDGSTAVMPENAIVEEGDSYTVQSATFKDGYQFIEYKDQHGNSVKPNDKLDNILDDIILTANVNVRVRTVNGDVWLGYGGNYDPSDLPELHDNCEYVIEENQLTNLQAPTTIGAICHSDPVNEKPVISGPEKVEIEQGKPINVDELGVKAHDKEDGELTPICMNPEIANTDKPRTFILRYQAIDSDGALSDVYELTVTVNEKQEEPKEPEHKRPTIEGPESVEFLVGDFIDQNALKVVAHDENGKKLIPECLNPEVIDMTKAGQFTLQYRAKDSNGLLSDVHEVTVIVKDRAVYSPATGVAQDSILYIVLSLAAMSMLTGLAVMYKSKQRG